MSEYAAATCPVRPRAMCGSLPRSHVPCSSMPTIQSATVRVKEMNMPIELIPFRFASRPYLLCFPSLRNPPFYPPISDFCPLHRPTGTADHHVDLLHYRQTYQRGQPEFLQWYHPTRLARRHCAPRSRSRIRCNCRYTDAEYRRVSLL